MLRQPNRGVAAARNAGLGLAAYPWVCFLDADDWLAPEAFRRLLDLARERPSASVLVVCAIVVREHGRTSPYARRDLTDPFAVFCGECPILIHSALVRRGPERGPGSRRFRFR